MVQIGFDSIETAWHMSKFYFGKLAQIPKWLKGPVCKTGIRRFESDSELKVKEIAYWIIKSGRV